MNNQAADIQLKIREHLSKTKEEFNNHLTGKEKFLFKLALRTPERKAKFQKILTWISKALGDEVLDEDKKDSLAEYKTLYDNWNENQKDYDGSLDFGGSLLTLKSFLDKSNEPPKGGGGGGWLREKKT